ncbi:hypothetical protein GOP47_0009938 [Adiantum capillus-veneris]|uniref:Uncharacterized protein n=1 Tax=Adiantum capillus-veneris TaxID=13818 RepID=A0A9D4ZJ66_ADICA|nr:hypothetical protein GOP47_0009938 [Adiantum capillus-veneris]
MLGNQCTQKDITERIPIKCEGKAFLHSLLNNLLIKPCNNQPCCLTDLPTTMPTQPSMRGIDTTIPLQAPKLKTNESKALLCWICSKICSLNLLDNAQLMVPLFGQLVA